MATFGFRPYPGPDATKIVHLPHGASADFVTGDLVIFASGSVVIATSGEDVFGIALKDATTTTGTMIPIYVITPGDRFIAQSTATTAEANKGVAYLLLMTKGSMGVVAGTTSTPGFYIDELDPRDGPTTGAGGRVIGRFLYTSMDAIGG